MTQQRLISRQYRNGPDDPEMDRAPCPEPPENTCLVGDFNPSFHRIDACSPNCDDAPTIDPDDCNAFGLAPGNIYCFPAHIGQTNVPGSFDDSDANETLVNRVCKSKGKYYGWLNGHIWEFNWLAEDAIFVGASPSGAASGDPGGIGEWTVAASPGGMANTNSNNRALGLYPILLSGSIPIVATAVQESATQWKSVRLNRLTNVWESGVISGGFSNWTSTNGSVHSEVRYRNRIYFITSERADIKVYDPGLQTINSIPVPSTIRFPMDLCVFHDRLFLLSKNNLGDVILYEVFEAGLSLIFTLISSNLSGTDNYEGRNSIFVDNRNESTPRMYCVNFINSTIGGNAGLEAWEIELVSGVLVNNGRIQSIANALPFGVNGPGGITEDIIVRVFNDSLLNPLVGGQPLLEIRPNGNVGSLYQSYTWRGKNLTSLIWGGLQVHFVLSYAHERSADIGSRVGMFGAPDIRIRQIRPVASGSGGVRIDYELETTASSFPNGTPMAARFTYDREGHSHRQLATIMNPSHGTITSDNRNLITADSGTLYTVEWDFRQDGFNISDPVYMVGHISTTGVSP